jgi:hypothetical protein
MQIYPYDEETRQRLLAQAQAVLAAVDKSAREALRMHKRIGNPVASWENGRVVWVQPEDIPVDD